MSLDALSPSHWHPVDWSIVGPALVAGLLVLSTHVPLGQRVVWMLELFERLEAQRLDQRAAVHRTQRRYSH